jgi:hypothetical protein
MARQKVLVRVLV